MARRWPHLEIVAALVEARANGGKVKIAGAYGAGAWLAVKHGFAEAVHGTAELNLRGQDIADEALALAKPMLYRTTRGERRWLGRRSAP